MTDKKSHAMVIYEMQNDLRDIRCVVELVMLAAESSEGDDRLETGVKCTAEMAASRMKEMGERMGALVDEWHEEWQAEKGIKA